MDMLARYLQALRSYLPRKDQDDIVRELSDNLLSQMEDREEALGRPLSEDEQADILRRHGHPMIVASRYRRGQHLIGPVFFPIYVFALKVGLGIAALVTVVLAVVAAALHGDPARQALEALGAYGGRALVVFAWTTLGFAVFEMAQSRVKIRSGCDWDPRKLPKVITQDSRSDCGRLANCTSFLPRLCGCSWCHRRPSCCWDPPRRSSILHPSGGWPTSSSYS